MVKHPLQRVHHAAVQQDQRNGYFVLTTVNDPLGRLTEEVAAEERLISVSPLLDHLERDGFAEASPVRVDGGQPRCPANRLG